MTLCLCEHTALSYLRLSVRESGVDLQPCRVRRIADTGIRPADIRLLPDDVMDPAGPVRLLVPSAAARRSIAGVKCRVWSTPMPDGAFLKAGDGLLVSSPEFVFVQMASRLSLVRLVQLGDELCGAFSLHPRGDRSFHSIESPLTTKERIGAFVGELAGAPGLRRARRAMRFLVDGSASPMESDLEMKMCLPRMLGGYGFPAPTLNARIDLPRGTRSFSGRRYVKPDFYWPEHRLAVDYDSDQEHTGSERIERDAKRRNAFEALGIRHVVVTRRQLMDAQEFDDIMRGLCKLANVRYCKPGETQILARRELHRELFSRFRD